MSCHWKIQAFFVQSAYDALRERWRLLCELAWPGRGFSIELTRIPDYAMDWVLDFVKEASERERRQAGREA